MHGSASRSAQSMCENGAPNWPPCVTLFSGMPPELSGNNVVTAGTHDWSVKPWISVPPPVVRQVTGVSQLALLLHVLVSVVIAWPQLLWTHLMSPVADASPETVTVPFSSVGQ